MKTKSGLPRILEVRIAGKGMSPDTLRASELAELLKEIEDTLIALMLRSDPDAKREDLVIGLVGISRGSARLEFSSSSPALAKSAVAAFSSAIRLGSIDALPLSAQTATRRIASFVARRNCSAILRPLQGKDRAPATITPAFSTPLSPIAIRGTTTIYGKVERVGGKDPKVGLRISDSLIIYCDADQETAKELGAQLYSTVGVRGVANWTSDLKIESFRIEKVLPYRETSISDAIRALGEAVGSGWDDLDVESAVEQLREPGD